MHGNIRNGRSGGRRWILGGFLLAGAALGAIIGAYLWQSGLHDSRLEEAESSAAVATLLQDAGLEGQAAAELLQRYVEAGDPALIAEIQSHAAAGVAALTRAISQGDVPGGREIAVQGAGLADGAGQIVALRYTGDVAAAAAALESSAPAFRELSASLESAIAQKAQEAASLQESADAAQNAASWLLTAAAVLAVGMALALATLVARSLAKRWAPEATSSP